MKHLILGMAFAAALGVFADQKIMDIRPEANPKAGPTSVEWEAKHAAELTAEVTDAKIAALLQGGETAVSALLAEVRPNYQTDPLKACLIAAVSQSVMAANGAQRALWTKALLKAAEGAKEVDVKCYFLDQLRWCGSADQAAEVERIAAASGSDAVKQFAKMVALEITGAQQKKIVK